MQLLPAKIRVLNALKDLDEGALKVVEEEGYYPFLSTILQTLATLVGREVPLALKGPTEDKVLAIFLLPLSLAPKSELISYMLSSSKERKLTVLTVYG